MNVYKFQLRAQPPVSLCIYDRFYVHPKLTVLNAMIFIIHICNIIMRDVGVLIFVDYILRVSASYTS